LPRTFYSREASEVAPDLLGRIVVRRGRDGGRITARIVETEAYAPDDPASHAFRGPTTRNAVMFGPPGYLYVYFIYGMHFCMNVVVGQDGVGTAVLLRAAEPLEGLSEMRARRGRDRVRDLCSGPARLCQALGVDRSLDGTDLVGGTEVWIEQGSPVEGDAVATGPRVGIRVGVEHDWRYLIRDDPFVSPGRPVSARRSVTSDPSKR
jgi:DNA-3-methyladenine glycosylase